MLSYIGRRLLLTVPTLLGITILVFAVMSLSPGNVATMLRSAEGDMRPEERKRIEQYVRRRYGLDLPRWRQYLRWLNQISPVGYKYRGTDVELPLLQKRFDALRAAGKSPAEAYDTVFLEDADTREDLSLSADGSGLVVGRAHAGEGFPRAWRFGLKVPNMGESFIRRRSVIDVILDALPQTLLLNLLAIPIIYSVAIAAGVRAARHRGKTFDVASGTTFLALYSMPSIWIGTMLIGFFASKDYFAWFPTGGLHDVQAAAMPFFPRFAESGFVRGWLLDTVWHLVLPVACMTYGGFAFLSKLMRASVLENVLSDFARTARAKGLADRVVLYRHVLANSILPLITVAAAILPGLLGGSLIIESIFSIDGMGRMMIEAIRMKDQELVLSEVCVVSLISLLSLIGADICYALADPRVSYE